MTAKFFILGGSGHAKETCLHILDTFPNAEIKFIDEFAKSDLLIIKNRSFDIITDWDKAEEFKSSFQFIIGVGIPETKRKILAKALAHGLEAAPTIIHPSAVVQDAKVGKGGMIAPGVIVTANVTIEDYVVLNYNCTVGHDSVIGKYTTCNPSSSVSGNCTLSEGVYFGVGAAIKEGKSIAPRVTVGGKAFVSKDIQDEGTTWVGVPAKKIK